MLDCLWFTHSKRVRIKGTENLGKDYEDYKFYLIGSLKGTFIGLPVCFIIGLLIQLLSIIL